MCASELVTDKYEKVCEDFLNLAILTKSSTGEIWLTFGHAAVGNKSVAFALAGNLSSPSVIFFNIKTTFSTDGKNIHFPIAEVLFRAAAGDLAQSKK